MQLAHSRSELDLLNKSALAHLLASDTPDAFDEYWAFIAKHFDILFQVPEHIAPLRQSILEMAACGKLTHREPSEEPASEILQRIYASKHDNSINVEFQKKEKKEHLPNGWALATIGDLVSQKGAFIDGNWVESKDQDPEGEVRLTQLADVGDGVYRNRSNRFMTRDKANQLRCTFLEPDDILIARMPEPLGRACLFPGDSKPCVTVVDVCIVRVGTDEIDGKWLTYAINSPGFRASIGNLQTGTTRQRISRSNLATLTLKVPPLGEQRRIVKRVEQLLGICDALESRLRFHGGGAREAGRGCHVHGGYGELKPCCLPNNRHFKRLRSK